MSLAQNSRIDNSQMNDGGILLIDKPPKLTSQQTISIVKRRLNLSKIGHAGTLDPFATGLLVCLVGKATKLSSTMMVGVKRYIGTFHFGLKTSTDDITGTTLEESSVVLDEEEVWKASRNFIGEISQIPPSVSAVKVNGVRAYKAARRDQPLMLQPKMVEVLSFNLSKTTANEYSFEITCGKGTYIRAIARDLGEMLGVGGCVASLRRVVSGSFAVSEAKGPNEVTLTDILPSSELSTIH